MLSRSPIIQVYPPKKVWIIGTAMGVDQTIPEAFLRAAQRNRDRIAFWDRDVSDRWISTTWREYADLVQQAALAMIGLGVEPGDGVNILAENCPEWFLANLGAMFVGARPTGVYTTNSPPQCQAIASHSDASVVFVESAKHLAMFKQLRDDLPRLKAIVVIREEVPEEPGVLSWNEFLKLGESVAKAELDSRTDTLKPEDVAMYVYTSGSTGSPKAAMLTHRSVLTGAWNPFEQLSPVEEERVISYLPLSHIAEQGVSLYGPMKTDAVVWFSRGFDRLPETLQAAKPTTFAAVPRVWEKMREKMAAAAAQNTGLKRMLGQWARSVGAQASDAQQGRGRYPLLYPIAEKLVFQTVKKRLGLEHCRACVTTAAPASPDLLAYFGSLGISLLEIYGMTEASGAIAMSLSQGHRRGWVGHALPGVEVKVRDDGELCLRGPTVFAGYFKDDEGTRRVFDEDGWLRTGDIGEIDDGFIRITGRCKDIIITAGGKNIAPAALEARLQSIPGIGHAVVAGDRRKFLVALLTLDPERFELAVKEAGSSTKSPEEAAKDPLVYRWLERQVQQANSHVARVETIKRFSVLPQALTIDGGELTPTMKVKRGAVLQKYERVLSSLYEESSAREADGNPSDIEGVSLEATAPSVV